MKRIISVLLLAVMVCGVLASCGSTGGSVKTPAGMKLISGEDDAYRLFVPEKWIVNNSKGITGAYRNEADTSNISVTTFLRLDKNPDGTTKAPSTTEIPSTTATPDTSAIPETSAVPDTSAPETTAPAKRSEREVYIDRFWAKCVISYTNELNGFKIIEQGEKTKLGGLEAKKYVYTAVYEGVEYKNMKIVTEFGGLMYIFEYTATSEKYDGNLDEIKWIISEFKFIDGIS